MATDMTLMPRFLALSCELTAFDEFDLVGTGQAETYLGVVTNVVGGEVVAELVGAHAGIVADAAGATEDRDALLRRRILSDAKLGPVARNVIKLWYVGTWYELPREWSETFGVRELDVTHVVSPISYTEGLLWPAVGANPNGAKGPGYGTWADPPRIPELPEPAEGTS